MIRKMRIEFVKRDFTPVQNQPITKQLTGDSNLSSKILDIINIETEAIKIFGNQSNGFSEIYGDDESEEEDYYSDPYEKLVASRKSPERANAFENLLEYTNSSTQNPELLKTVKIAAYDMESEDSKGMRKNTYYRPPRRIVYNISKNFGQSMV